MSDKEAWPCPAPDRAKFAAREYVASIEREVVAGGEVLSPDYVESTSLAYESGYLRGSNDAYEDLLKSLKELRADAREAGRLESETERIDFETKLLRREAEVLQQSNEAGQQLLEALQREVMATKAMKQLEERIQALEARKAESP